MLTGFLLVSEGFQTEPGTSDGIEEVPTMSVLQQLHPEFKILLLEGYKPARETSITTTLCDETKEIQWNTTFIDPIRAAAHAKKMTSKTSRAETQMIRLNASAGHVIHMK